MSAPVGLGAVGLGRMGRVYADFAASQLQNARLVAVSDSRPDAMAKYSGVTHYPDYHDLLRDPNVQGVIIATPTSTHHELVIAAAEAGKAIFCEKPTALTLSATDDMLRAVDKAGVMFQVGFMRRFDKAYLGAWQHIEAGEIGTPITVRSISRDPFRTSLEYADPDVSGGIIVDMGIHDMDVVRWMMQDDIERVYTEWASLAYPELLGVNDVDNAQISLRFRRGGIGNVEVSRTAFYGYDIQAEVIGTKGTLRIGYLQETPVTLFNRQGGHIDIVPHFPERFGAAYTAQIAHFADCLQSGKPPRVTPNDARAALEAAIAATVSGRMGRVVHTNEAR